MHESFMNNLLNYLFVLNEHSKCTLFSSYILLKLHKSHGIVKRILKIF